jgi:hypothetical protein
MFARNNTNDNGYIRQLNFDVGGVGRIEHLDIRKNTHQGSSLGSPSSIAPPPKPRWLLCLPDSFHTRRKTDSQMCQTKPWTQELDFVDGHALRGQLRSQLSESDKGITEAITGR